jgi:hypothetical protein
MTKSKIENISLLIIGIGYILSGFILLSCDWQNINEILMIMLLTTSMNSLMIGIIIISLIKKEITNDKE